MRFKSQQIVLYCLGLYTQNQGLRQVDLQPRAKEGSGKMNMLKERKKDPRKKQVVSYSLDSPIDLIT